MPITIGNDFLGSKLFTCDPMQSQSFLTRLWDRVKDFFFSTGITQANAYLKELCDFERPPDRERLYEIFHGLYSLASSSSKDYFGITSFEPENYIRMFIIKEGETLLSITLSDNMSQYTVMGHVMTTIETPFVYVRNNPDIKVMRCSSLCTPLGCLFPSNLVLENENREQLKVDLTEVKSTLIAMQEKEEAFEEWKKQEKKPVFLQRLILH
ncbi:hypothetical protein FNI11_01695 [Salmonella enterica subsp. salamae]|nr:hypothetical protein [Salmonella enterica subsp. salamae]ECJ2279644.1 hypothetical protein [Salmonella enterica subsp. salamae]HCC0887908.1 hypothetical protein [Salmonella enterica]